MMKRILILCVVVAWCATATAFAQGKQYAAAAPEVEYIGRTLVGDDASVSFDWSGTYFYVRFTGGKLAMRVSDTKKNYYNLYLDGKLQKEVVTTFGADSLIVLAQGLSKGEHLVCLQKRTEGEQGCTTIHGFEVAQKGALMPANMRKSRRILYIGDSLTCGFGTEGASKEDPFLPETENCNWAYGCILARYFDADYTLLSHSGRGMARNYGDAQPVSAAGTLNSRIGNTFDEQTIAWTYPADSNPDVVVINLGTNDFSTRPHPSQEEFTAAYRTMINTLRAAYGDVPIVCVSARINEVLFDYVRTFVMQSRDEKLFFAAFLQHYCNGNSDLGSVGHPNYEGQRKMAAIIAPYISTATGWAMPHKTIE